MWKDYFDGLEYPGMLTDPQPPFPGLSGFTADEFIHITWDDEHKSGWYFAEDVDHVDPGSGGG